MAAKTTLENYFLPFRKEIIGINASFESPFGSKKIIYTDWTASGRLYRSIEKKIAEDFGPFVANTHTETSVTGTAMTKAYHLARKTIKTHVNANKNDILIVSGTGMTGVINKLHRILGLRFPENLKNYVTIPNEIKPVVFISHMEHHSNQTTWLETIAEVVIIPANKEGLFCLENFEKTVQKYNHRPFKIASITACSNVTGIKTPYHKIAKIMHKNNGVCFVDFACSAPYVDIDMHPEDKEAYLDAIFFSPHKFLGGPGTSGIMIFNKNLYKNNIPDCPGGGTVKWTNPWGEHQYIDSIEEREDGGTPGFIQVIRTALAINLKEKMTVEKILAREQELLNYTFLELEKSNNIHLLAAQHKSRLGIFSFYIDDLHYNLGVKLLNDKFGIQTRGGCSCAGTYGHYLLHVDKTTSHNITCEISRGELEKKPGWIRMSIHPTTSTEEIELVCNAITTLAKNHKEWAKDYVYNSKTNEFTHSNFNCKTDEKIAQWFEM